MAASGVAHAAPTPDDTWQDWRLPLRYSRMYIEKPIDRIHAAVTDDESTNVPPRAHIA
jgi:hypothetical protein